MLKLSSCVAAAAAAVLAGAPATTGSAAVIDPTADILPSYTGPTNPDLDILAASVSYDGTYFHLSATQAGAVGSTAGSLYVWGINRGAGTARLSFGSPSIGSTVLFDAVAVMFPDGLGRAVAFPAMGPPSITPLPGLVEVDGNTISASFLASYFPSRGFAPEDYTFTLWSRKRVDPAADGLNSEIADFAPDRGGIHAAIPEPATWAMMILGFGLGGTMLRRRRAIAYA